MSSFRSFSFNVQISLTSHPGKPSLSIGDCPFTPLHCSIWRWWQDAAAGEFGHGHRRPGALHRGDTDGFENDRSAEAFKLPTSSAEKGQVICLNCLALMSGAAGNSGH